MSRWIHWWVDDKLTEKEYPEKLKTQMLRTHQPIPSHQSLQDHLEVVILATIQREGKELLCPWRYAARHARAFVQCLPAYLGSLQVSH